jgi:PKD repeat protein
MKRLLFYVLIVVFVVACSSGDDAPDPDPIPANQPPSASFAASPQQGQAPLEVSFDATGSSDNDGSVASYTWDFGNGATDIGESVQYTFAEAGEYTVSLVVTDDDDATDTVEQIITVLEQPTPPPPSPPANELPIPNFNVTMDGREAPLTVTFDGSTAVDNDGTITTYAWDFGDGNTAEGITVEHTYTTAGEYTVTFTVTDDDGDSVSGTTNIIVAEPSETEPQPNADYTGTWAWVGQFELTGTQFVGYVEYSIPLDNTNDRRNVQTGPWLFCATDVVLCPDAGNPSGIGLIGELSSEDGFDLFASFAEGVDEIRLIAFDDDNAIGDEFDGDPSFFGRGIWTFDSGLESNMFLGMTKLENPNIFTLERLKKVVSQTEVKQGSSQVEQMKQVLDAIQDAF